MSVVIDASVAVSWAVESQRDDYALAVFRALSSFTCVVPAHWSLEVTNAVLVNERRRALTVQQAELFFGTLEAQTIQYEDILPKRVHGEVAQLARQQGLTVYDAAYLELAQRASLPLATLDGALVRAARDVRVPIFQPAT